jgi:hypothetical protein
VPELSFTIEGAEPLRFAVAPLLALKLRVSSTPASQPIEAILLRCQVQIDATRREYDEAEEEGLRVQFGAPARWGQTLRSLLWTQASMTIPAFTGSVVADLHLPCSYDFNLAATNLFYALRDGEVPLSLLFSGTIFYSVAGGMLQVAQVPWSQEATYRLPVRVWKETMEHYHPNSVFLSLRKDIFERLHRYQARAGLPTLAETVERLLGGVEEPS